MAVLKSSTRACQQSDVNSPEQVLDDLRLVLSQMRREISQDGVECSYAQGIVRRNRQVVFFSDRVVSRMWLPA